MSKHPGIDIEVLSTLRFLKHFKSGILFIHITYVNILMDTLGVRMAQYAAHRNFSVPVKALPKLVL